MKLSDTLSLIAILVTCCIFVYNNIKDHYLQIEKTRPIINPIAKLENINGKFEYLLTIKNFGQTEGVINEVNICPEYKDQKAKYLEPNAFIQIHNFHLAPNQEIKTIVDFGPKSQMDLVNKRNITINYSPDYNLKKTYTSQYSIREKEYPEIRSHGNFNEIYYLEKISNSLNILAGKQSNNDKK